ncbi:hypothetical protein J2Y00_002814 [Deinococcus soli (ex Cha et al. 2016)]|uniref:Uncharacterized protein n=2 Tax=Deinococcus soli (ex Cha et al. 2016) TaxID=1309411 RepID=A0AAE4BN76_9DEIO|nr:hypothetical protein [Deinococcus soli (ex Cha et al. 2016)]MDR6329466.1 hypothetical protein [Deinococcus soli (ex Cha et al. 2016)]MDR6752126.1 hypothetical protein [Deinococcus soli (ex Cha et al. 2016)]
MLEDLTPAVAAKIMQGQPVPKERTKASAGRAAKSK